MTLTFRDTQGFNLSADQVDANFRDLDDRVTEIEDNPPEAVGIASVSVDDLNLMTFTMTDDTTRGPLVLPTAKSFNPKGEWEAGTDYLFYDVVEHNGAAYLVRVNHTSDSEFDENADHGDGLLYRLVLRRPELPFEIDFFKPGSPGVGIDPDEAIFTYRCARAFWLPADLTDSVAGLERSTNTQLVFPIYKNRDSIGTLTIGGTDSESESEGEAESDIVWDFPDVVQFTPGDRLRIMEPGGDSDDNAFDLSITIVAQQGTAP